MDRKAEGNEGPRDLRAQHAQAHHADRELCRPTRFANPPGVNPGGSEALLTPSNRASIRSASRIVIVAIELADMAQQRERGAGRIAGEIAKSFAELRSVSLRAQAAPRDCCDLPTMALVVERSDNISHGEAGSDNEDAIVGADAAQDVRLPWIGDESGVVLQRCER